MIFSSLLLHADFQADGKMLLLPTAPREEMSRVLFQQKRSLVWNENFAHSLTIAQNSGKTLLLAFMGAGWCPWSEKLEREILNEPAFLEPLRDEVQFVWLSCPEESKRSGPELLQLKEKYGVEEFPTLVFITPSQEEMFKVGYLPLNPKEFSLRVKKMIADYRELFHALDKDLRPLTIEELEALYVKARDLNATVYKDQLMQAGLSRETGTFFLIEKYTQLVESDQKQEAMLLREKIIQRDPKNLKGSHLRLAILDFQTRALRVKKKDTPVTVVKPLAEYVKRFGEKDPENLWKVQMMMAQYLFTKNNVEEALKLAQASLQSAPQESKREIAETIDYLKSRVR
ncbi:MAG: thioredoxin fold domain-containing protein [Chlamydiales bacterium]